MERLHQRIKAAKRALNSLGQLVDLGQPNEVERDATIQRFEFTYEACWKAAKQFLYDVEGLDVGSPKSVIRSSRQIQLFNEEEAILGLNMVNDRNLTVHTYNEEVAIKIHSSIKLYFPLLSNWVMRMENRI